MTQHAEVLSAISSALGPVTLISRLYEPRLRIPPSFAAAFLPDLHLTSNEAAKSFKGFFFRPELRPTLKLLLGALDTLPGLEKVQLGDRYDLWREEGAGREKGGKARQIPDMIADIRKDHGSAVALLDASHGWKFLAGNHDEKLSRRNGDGGFRDAEELLSLGATSVVGKDPAILATHGDTFDPIEVLPEAFKKGILHATGKLVGEPTLGISRDLSRLRVARSIGPISNATYEKLVPPFPTQKHPRLPAVSTEEEVASVLTGPAFNVMGYPPQGYWAEGPDQAVLTLLQAARRRSRAMAEILDLSFPAPKLCVIGHTHNPRIILTLREDETTPFVLMDCGGWVGRCRYVPSGEKQRRTYRSAHLGVAVGCDLRLYQLSSQPV